MYLVSAKGKHMIRVHRDWIQNPIDVDYIRRSHKWVAGLRKSITTVDLLINHFPLLGLRT